MDRLKSFKICVLQSYSSGGILTSKPEWFATTRTGALRGLFGSLWRMAMQSEENLKAVIYLVNYYTGFRYTSIDTPLIKEYAKIILAPPVREDNPHVIKFQSDFKGALRVLGLSRGLKIPDPIPFTYALPGKETQARSVRDAVTSLWGSCIFKNHKPLLEKAVGSRLGDALLSTSNPVVGKVYCTFQGGLKTRWFAAPNSVLQRALEPLKDGLFRLLKRLPWDCTYNQRKADWLIQARLRAGSRVFSVDMSKATDTFPWLIQKGVLSELVGLEDDGGREAVALFIDIVEKGRWELDGLPAPVFWRRGQPLGLGPSFPVFALTHGILLFLLNNRRWDMSWFILGDDVVIFDEQLHMNYCEFLSSVGVKVSETKSISSNVVAQFAGRTLTAGLGFHQPSWRNIEKRKLLDIAAWWYPGFEEGLDDAGLIKLVLSLPKPYGRGRSPDYPLLADALLDLLIERKLEEEDEPRPAITVPRLSRLAHIRADKDVRYPWFVQELIPYRPRRQTVPVILRNIIDLLDGTDVSGYPRVRYVQKDSKSPFTLGNIAYFSAIFEVLVGSQHLEE